MSKFYIKSSFDLNENAKKRILSFYKKKFLENFPHDLDPNFPEWFFQSHYCTELRLYLKSKNLLNKIISFGAFICNTQTEYIGNPHVDIYHSKILSVIKSRFNILIEGSPTDKMFWWTKVSWYTKDLEERFFELNGIEYKSLAIKGNNIQSRWVHLGEPDEIACNILTPSAFVKTDCAHTVIVSPGPRLIFTVGFNTTLDEIC